MSKSFERERPPPYTENMNIPGVHIHPGSSAPPPPYNTQLPPGYQHQYTPPPAGFVPAYGATNIIVTPAIIAVGACPACRVGILEDDFTCLGLLCAIAFFPLGILCCLALKNKRCSNCRAYFS